MDGFRRQRIRLHLLELAAALMVNSIASFMVLVVLTTAGVCTAASPQTIQVGRVALQIPALYEYEDDEGTLVAWPRGSESIVIRVTAHTLLRDDQPVPGAGVAFTSEQAAKKKLKLERKGEAVWYHTEGPATDGPPGSLMHFWNVGLGAHALVVSCYVDASVRDRPQAAEALAEVLQLIASLREAGGPTTGTAALQGKWRIAGSDGVPLPDACQNITLEIGPASIRSRSGTLEMTTAYEVIMDEGKITIRQSSLTHNGGENCQGISAEYVVEHFAHDLDADVIDDRLRLYLPSRESGEYTEFVRENDGA